MNEKTIKRLQALPRVSIENGITYYIIPQEEYEKLKDKEQECEKFKKQLERREENYQKLFSKSNKYIHNLVDENVQDISNLARRLEQFKVENDQFKQTLAEIKEIAEVEIECKTYEIENDCFNETRCKALNEHIDFIKQILQKISECEANNDR